MLALITDRKCVNDVQSRGVMGLVCISGYFETRMYLRTYVPITDLVTCATCIAYPVKQESHTAVSL